MASLASRNVLRSIENRESPIANDLYRRQGIVEDYDNSQGAYRVRLADGGAVLVPSRNVVTNGEIRGKPVIITWPIGSQPFLDSEIRG